MEHRTEKVKVKSMSENQNEMQEKNPSFLEQMSETILVETTTNPKQKENFSFPLSTLSVLGIALPQLQQPQVVTTATTINMQGFYKVANAQVGDALKKAKDGNFWGSIKRVDGSSAMAKFTEAQNMTLKNQLVIPKDPSTIAMEMTVAAALYSINENLEEIKKVQKQILDFLQTEKESQIEADVQTLMDLINKYKTSWDNDHFLASSHKLVLDIQRTARKNMNSYLKSLENRLQNKKNLVISKDVKEEYQDLEKDLKYYRLSLYNYSLASFMEIMFSGNFKEDYIHSVKKQVEKLSMQYRQVYSECYDHLKKMSNASIGKNVLKGIGTAGKNIGGFIGSIPVIKEGPVDEFLQENGSKIVREARSINSAELKQLSNLRNPNTGVFTDRMQDMIQIFNKTTDVYIDHEKVYLVSE
jgi:hypothetical protein